MKYSKLLFLFLLLNSWACEDPTTGNSGSTTTTTVPKTTTPEPANNDLKATTNSEGTTTNLAESTAAPEKHDCTIKGELLEDNECYLRDAQTLVCIVADSTTQDMDFGDSHRILEVYDTKNCTLLAREELPVNYSPDFPYYLNLQTYEPKNKTICTQGFEYTFCYDVANRKMMPRMEAQFLSERNAEDAQSGAPQGLLFWDQYLFAYAQDYGAYAFNFVDKANIKAMLPSAEYTLPKRGFEYNALFLAKQGADRYQAIVPVMEGEETKMGLKKLFAKPLKIDPVVSKNVRNNRYIVFNDLETQKRLAIDMEKVELVKLPTDLETQKSTAILKWLKARS